MKRKRNVWKKILFLIIILAILGIETTARADVDVNIDIKPGSDPNCFNINGHGVVPVAILGSSGFNVNNIDTETLFFAGLAMRVRGNRGPLCSYEYVNDDYILDMVCHFEDSPDLWSPGDGVAELSGALLDGTSFKGTDSICVVNEDPDDGGDGCIPPCDGGI